MNAVTPSVEPASRSTEATSEHRNVAAGTLRRAASICDAEMSTPVTRYRSASRRVQGTPVPQPRSTRLDPGGIAASNSGTSRSAAGSTTRAASRPIAGRARRSRPRPSPCAHPSRGSAPMPAAQPEHAARLEREVLELGRRPDLVGGQRVQVVHGQVAAARVCRAGRRSRSPGPRRKVSIRSDRPASYQQSPARMTSASGGGRPAGPVATSFTRDPLARALSRIAATANGSMSTAVTGAPASIAAIAHRPDPSQVEHPAAGDDLGWSPQVASDREAAAPRERPVGKRGVGVAGLHLDRSHSVRASSARWSRTRSRAGHRRGGACGAGRRRARRPAWSNRTPAGSRRMDAERILGGQRRPGGSCAAGCRPPAGDGCT